MTSTFRKGDKVEWDSHAGTAVGVVEDKITTRTEAAGRTVDASPEELKLADAWTRRGLARSEDAVLRLTAEGWLLLDRLAVELASAAEAGRAPAGAA